MPAATPRPAVANQTRPAHEPGRPQPGHPHAANHLPRGQARTTTRSHDRRLLTSELVTNALRYGNGNGIRLTVRQTPHALRVEVHDANPAAPRLSQNLDGTAEQGRGLHIIDSLATRWGHTPSADPAGKTVWFELHHRQTAGLDHSE